MKLADGISKDEKKLVRKMFWRSMTMYASVNPVTMGGGGFGYSMMPFINHFYKSEEDRAAALERHSQYFSDDHSLRVLCYGECGIDGEGKF